MLQFVEQRISFLEKETAALEEKIRMAPEGKLRIYTSGGYSRWLVSMPGGDRIYLRKSQVELANALWKKQENIGMRDRYSRELKEMRRLKNMLQKIYDTGDRHLSRQMNSEVIKDIAGFSTVDNWENESFCTNPYPFDGNGEKGPRGIRMRSKSEVIIAMTFETFGIPYRYECGYMLNGRMVYPDFMLKRPSDGKIILWEHFGRWDDEGYHKNAVNKLDEYLDAGLAPYDDLMFSIETSDRHVDMDVIANMLRTFVLN